MTPWEITLHQYMMGKTQKFRGFCAKNLTWAAGRKSQKTTCSFLRIGIPGFPWPWGPQGGPGPRGPPGALWAPGGRDSGRPLWAPWALWTLVGSMMPVSEGSLRLLALAAGGSVGDNR